jgi:transmembrane 9 superfamily protein 2/4
MMKVVALLALLGCGISDAKFLPGVQPLVFSKNAKIDLKVNAMTSVHTQLPKDYYRLPFCRPSDGVHMASENLGEFLTGNKIENSPYHIRMLEDKYCQIVCQVKLGQEDPMEVRRFKAHIKLEYHNNWIVDNLPSARIMDSSQPEKRHYAGGFPIGFTQEKEGAPEPKNKREKRQRDNKKFTADKRFFPMEDCYVYNHVHIHIEYHAETDGSGYRVVGFAVAPLSVKHVFANQYQWDGKDPEGFNQPLTTCKPQEPLSWESIKKNQVVADDETILYTYDVSFHESPIEWSTRWDIYLTEDSMIPAKVHWYSINNSIMVLLLLSFLVGGILVRNLKRDIAGYNAVPLTDEEREEETDEKGWKLVHSDVFRPPTSYPMIFCVLNGSGLQLALTSLFAIVVAAVGFISPAKRGSLINGMLVFYMLCGIFAGYWSARLYKCFKGRQWQLCTLLTSLFFPGICFTLFLFFNIVQAFFKSTGAVPFLDVLILAAMWCCVTVPLVFLGAYFGYKHESFQFPCKVATIERVIPPSKWFQSTTVCIVTAGLIPFSAAFVELFFIMTSLWMDQYYYLFGFTLMVFGIIVITTCEITMLLTYYQLCAENHRWWWFSFLASGSCGMYLFAYSFFWFKQLHASKMVVTYMLYFGYMFLISFGLSMITGTAGFFSTFWFVKKIFATIKVD